MTERTRHPITETPTDRICVSPSILAADFASLGAHVHEADVGGAEIIHIDVMDGHFVPNLSMGPGIVKCIRPITDKCFDVHLMLTNPERYLEPFVEAGADHITVHVEIEADVSAVLRRIHDLGCSAGLCVKPGTPAEALRPYIKELELVLVMTVEPGFGGQSFRADMLPKIREIRRYFDEENPTAHLQVDGGIDPQTAVEVVKAGGNLLVAGSSVFRAPDGIAAAITALKQAR